MHHLYATIRRALVAAALSLALVPAARATEVPGHQDEGDLNRRRAEWIEQIHRAAPGVNWRDIEAANRLETMFLLSGAARPRIAGSWTEKGAANLTGRNFDCARTSDVTTP